MWVYILEGYKLSHIREDNLMSWEAWFAIAVVAGVIGLLVFTRYAPDLILMAGLTTLILTRTLPIKEALSGFSNEGMATVGVMFIIVAGLQETGAVTWISQYLFGQPKSVPSAQLRMMLPVTALSAFMNNTPLVAMMIPAINDWGRKFQISPSKLLIPLSYAAILGGTCTLIGTSTNLVVNGLLIAQTDSPGIGFFDLAWIGVPTAVIGIIYILVVSRWLLPTRQPAISSLSDFKEYSVEMLVDPNGTLVQKTVEQAGLRHLVNLYLSSIERDSQVIVSVSPREVLEANDRLVFVGAVDSVVELTKIRGLLPATNQVFKLDEPRAKRSLVEAVVSDTHPLLGKTIREGRFRNIYDAVVIAVARNGERLRTKMGSIRLREGDTLLLEAKPSFVEQQKNSRDFFLVSRIENSSPPRHDRAIMSMAIMVGMVLLASFSILPIFHAALLAAGLMILTRCVTSDQARRSIDWSLLVIIASSFGLGRALETTGAAQVLAGGLLSFAQGNPWLSLAVIYLITTFFTEIITNNGAAALMFPIALATANKLDVNFIPFVIAIMMAASASFATPIGYQTNLMVYGPGGYKFNDYLRIGIPLNLVAALVSILIIPLIWQF
jgi:di/tricarboxylate transporter